MVMVMAYNAPHHSMFLTLRLLPETETYKPPEGGGFAPSAKSPTLG